jgi:EAL domain-containing protein (putative c-di-GMP-specific phosphodiesterase class I)
MGEWVLREACRQNQEWRKQGLMKITMAVNLSAVQFRQKNLGEIIKDVLHESGLAPSGLELEITEGVVMQDAEAAILLLEDMKAMGLKISVDDFGTGYSSLSYLKRFPIDKFKIDQSFVRDLATDKDDAVIVSTIISMAHSLKLKVIAEGVETAEQLAFLKQQGCDEIQGYYFSKPVSAEEFTKLLSSGKGLFEL